MENKLKALLEKNDYLLLDGATGTVLMAAGLVSGAPPEEWNVIHPDRIRKMHRDYIAAGAHQVLTNSFGGTSFRLKLHNFQDRVFEFNKAAAELARAEADAVEREVLVAGSIGPSGELLEPMGEMSYEAAVSAFAEQARGLMAGGVDHFWIETMSDLNEVKAAVEGVRSVSDLPICATLSFDTNGRSMMGVTPADAVNTMKEWGLTAIGGNCGNNIQEIEDVIAEMHAAAPEVKLIAKANAGIPQWINNELVYDGTPAVMANYARRVRGLGASLIGGCCGNTPAHIKAMANALATPLTQVEQADLAEKQQAAEQTAVSDDTPKRSRRRRRRA